MNTHQEPDVAFDPFVLLTEEELHPADIALAAEKALEGGAGAVVTFSGIVRNNSRGPDGLKHCVDYLEYSAYEPMALREMRRVAEGVRARWNVPCAIAHRLGRLGIGEASVVIAVASPHRHIAFEACHWAIDELKATVPIWKKEVAQDDVWWVEDPTASARQHNR
ncbi:MAG TPA: molybdenum cofactor biosynthesis protein MoaE [Abditibacteriaceae bacterium]|jgi:molybdopterin synthase catalytic subunit